MDGSKLTNRVPKARTDGLVGAIVDNSLGHVPLTRAAEGAVGASMRSVVSTKKATQFGKILVSGEPVYTLGRTTVSFSRMK